jgi:hypothetical protein
MSVTLKSMIKDTKDGVSILKKWNNDSEFLSKFMNVSASTKNKRSPTMQVLNKFNLLYVVQSIADRSDGIYKIGVSKGVGRLNEYVKMHGAPESKNQKNRCTGVYIVFLAGQLRTDAISRSTTAGKLDAELVSSYYRHNKWSNTREKQIFDELTTLGYSPIRGNEWYQFKDNGDKLKKIVLKSVGNATKDVQSKLKAQIEEGKILKPGDYVISVVSHTTGNKSTNKGEYYYKLEWNTKQLSTLSSKEKKAKKKAVMTPYTYESLKTIYNEINRRNNPTHKKKTVGDDIVKLVHDYIVKHNLTTKDKTYGTHRKTRSSTY